MQLEDVTGQYRALAGEAAAARGRIAQLSGELAMLKAAGEQPAAAAVYRGVKALRKSRSGSGMSRQSDRAPSPLSASAISAADDGGTPPPMPDDPNVTGLVALPAASHIGDTTDSALLADFPGLEHAVAFHPAVVACRKQHAQLQRLVALCGREAARAAQHPDDEELERVMLNERFVALRGVAAEGQAVARHLARTRDDMLRRREEDLQLVLGSMQSMAVVHPREMQSLARVATAQRAGRVMALRADVVGGARLTATVERPATAMGLSQARGAVAAAAGGTIVVSTSSSPKQAKRDAPERPHSVGPGEAAKAPTGVMGRPARFSARRRR
jgi:hypothetical protein